MSLLNRFRHSHSLQAEKNTLQENILNKNLYVEQVAELTGWNHKKAEREMTIAQEKLGLPFSYYCQEQFPLYSTHEQKKIVLRYWRKEDVRTGHINIMSWESGFSKEKIERIIRNYDRLGIIEVNSFICLQYGIHLMKKNEVVDLLSAIKTLRNSTASLQKRLRLIDEGKLTYNDIIDEYNEYLELVKPTLTSYLKDSYSERIMEFLPELRNDSEALERYLADMEMSRLLLRFSISEYMMFHLYRSSLEEKRTYVNAKDRAEVIGPLNSKTTRQITGNKLRAYNLLKPFYDRDVVKIKGMASLPDFEVFVHKHPTFVYKPLFGSMGQGVRLESIDLEADIDKQLFHLLQSNNVFLMEELVISNEEMAMFNKDSLNTVRLIVYYNGHDTVPVSSFMRTGRPGSIVDNAGSGGIFASVDIETGVVNSDGGDEAGHIYERHPDSNIKYKGFQIPFWDQAVQVACNANRQLGEPNFIGWDLALNEKNHWVIIEGNSLPQFVHQGPLLHGLKSELIKLISHEQR